MNGSPRRAAWLGTLCLLFLLALFTRTLPGVSETTQQVPAVQAIPVQGNVYMLQFSNTLGNVGVPEISDRLRSQIHYRNVVSCATEECDSHPTL